MVPRIASITSISKSKCKSTHFLIKFFSIVVTLNLTYKSQDDAFIPLFHSQFIRITIPSSIPGGISISSSTIFLTLFCHQQVVHTFSKVSPLHPHLSQAQVCSIVPNIVCCLYFTYPLP